MKVTICELSDKQFKEDWKNLTQYTKSHESDLVLLPEMPFHPWIAHDSTVKESLKTESITSHEAWLKRLPELNAKIIAYSKPVLDGTKFYNTAYIWTPEKGHQKVRSKYFFPEEEDFFEATWFDRDDSGFELIEVNGIKIGFLLCTEIWFTQYARKYGLAGIDLLLCPRATGQSSVPQWIRCGQTLSVISGSYCLSSNRSGLGKNNFQWGGTGWVSQPMDGMLLGTTSLEHPFKTVEIDLEKTKIAKNNYPLYVKE